MCEVEHFNDFDGSRYNFKGMGDYFLFGFSTYGFDDIMQNGGKDILMRYYKDYYNPTIPAIEGCNITLGVNRANLPKRISILIVWHFV